MRGAHGLCILTCTWMCMHVKPLHPSCRSGGRLLRRRWQEDSIRVTWRQRLGSAAHSAIQPYSRHAAWLGHGSLVSLRQCSNFCRPGVRRQHTPAAKRPEVVHIRDLRQLGHARGCLGLRIPIFFQACCSSSCCEWPAALQELAACRFPSSLFSQQGPVTLYLSSFVGRGYPGARRFMLATPQNMVGVAPDYARRSLGSH